MSQDASHVPDRFVDLFGDGDGKKEDVTTVQPCLAVTINLNRIYHVLIIYEHIYIYIYVFSIYIHRNIYIYIYISIYIYINISLSIYIIYILSIYIYAFIFMISLVLFFCGVKTQRQQVAAARSP